MISPPKGIIKYGRFKNTDKQQTKGVISNFSSENIIDQNATHLSNVVCNLQSGCFQGAKKIIMKLLLRIFTIMITILFPCSGKDINKKSLYVELIIRDRTRKILTIEHNGKVTYEKGMNEITKKEMFISDNKIVSLQKYLIEKDSLINNETYLTSEDDYHCDDDVPIYITIILNGNKFKLKCICGECSKLFNDIFNRIIKMWPKKIKIEGWS